MTWRGAEAATVTTASLVHTNALQVGDTLEWNVTADVQATVEEGKTDIGWLIWKEERQPGEVVYYSKEGSQAAFGELMAAPRLLLKFN